MQFQAAFYRYVGSPTGPATIALGADSSPVTNSGTNGALPSAKVDNVFSFPQQNRSGVPVQRLMIAMNCPTATPNQTAALYVWDSGTQHWYIVDAAITLVPNTVVFVDAASSSDPNANSAQSSPGGSDYMLVVASTGGPPNGLYSFGVSPAAMTQ